MENRDPHAPKIVTYSIPKIEIYYVSGDELEQIEEGSHRFGQDLAFALTCSSVCITILVALAAGTFAPDTSVTLKVTAVITGLAAIYTGIRWWRNRNKGLDVITRIRKRKVDPETDSAE